MKADIIVAWPKNCDYPLWRLFITKFNQRFNQIYIIFTETNKGFDYREFVAYQLNGIKNVWVYDSPEVKSDQDWRNVAIQSALKRSRAPWVWFTEQDFYVQDGFFKEVDRLESEDCQVIAAFQESRMHPCSIFIARDLLIRFEMDFSILPNQLDHFGMIQKQIEEADVKIGKIGERFYFHYNGLSHNWMMVCDGQPPVYKPEEFIEYLKNCLESSVELHDEFKKTANSAILAFSA